MGHLAKILKPNIITYLNSAPKCLNFGKGGVHKGRHLLLGGEGVCQMVTQSDMEGGRGLAKGDVTSKCPKNEQIFPQESAASHKFV